jgi:hypothetical protein
LLPAAVRVLLATSDDGCAQESNRKPASLLRHAIYGRS